MKIIVFGGSGFIGKKLVSMLRRHGHDVVPASPSLGVNAVTGEGLAAALAGAQVTVDVTNSPSYEDQAVMDFFTTTTRHLLAQGATAGVRHHVLLSIVGIDGLPECGYYRAKLAQEKLIRAAAIPFTIVRATQFFEFIPVITQLATTAQTVRLPAAGMQPILGDDVADVLAEIATQPPVNGTLELAGPEVIAQDELARRWLKSQDKTDVVVTDPAARYFGAQLQPRSLLPGEQARLGRTRFDDWLAQGKIAPAG